MIFSYPKVLEIYLIMDLIVFIFFISDYQTPHPLSPQDKSFEYSIYVFYKKMMAMLLILIDIFLNKKFYNISSLIEIFDALIWQIKLIKILNLMNEREFMINHLSNGFGSNKSKRYTLVDDTYINHTILLHGFYHSK